MTGARPYPKPVYPELVEGLLFFGAPCVTMEDKDSPSTSSGQADKGVEQW
jgi:hypothetical protein